MIRSSLGHAARHLSYRHKLTASLTTQTRQPLMIGSSTLLGPTGRRALMSTARSATVRSSSSRSTVPPQSRRLHRNSRTGDKVKQQRKTSSLVSTHNPLEELTDGSGYVLPPTQRFSFSSTAESSLSPMPCTEQLKEEIMSHALQPQTSVSLHTLMRTGRGDFLDRTFGEEMRERNTATELVLMQVAGFLRRELPIRLAHRIQDLNNIHILNEMPSIMAVRDLYVKSFEELWEFSRLIETQEQEEGFARVVENIYERHANVIVQMAQGAFEFRKMVRKRGLDFELQQETHEFLDRFYICRIGMRVLIGQYLALRQPPVPNYIGIICSQTSPFEIVKRAIDDAAFMCTRRYGDAPEVVMSGRLDMTFPYVPTHLHYIMLELLKNSMRATVEWHGIDANFPAIKVVIADGDENEDVVIKVSDEGGGISRSNMKKIWSYLFTTADPSIQEGMVGGSDHAADHGIDAPLAGLGYGLPISRSYCRYFGGDLSVMSMEGHGTDAFVYLARLGDSREPLPT